MEVALPDPPPEYGSLPHWLSDLIDVKLKKLLDQGDFQRVRELSLALITVLNEVGQPNLHRLKSSTGFSSFKKKKQTKKPNLTIWEICLFTLTVRADTGICASVPS